MASTTDTGLGNDESFLRYITLIFAFKCTGEGLEDTVKRSVVDLYQKISRKCQRVEPCAYNCTNVHGSKFKNWCNSCTRWRKEISRFANKPGHDNRVEWKIFDSKDWTKNLESSTNQVANVFVHKCKHPKNSITNDISDILSLFENCSYFGFKEKSKLLRDIRDIRNTHFAHNSSYRMEENDLQYCLNKLSSLLNQRLFQADKKCKEMHKRIRDLKNYNYRIKVEEITEATSIIQPLVRLHPNKPMIVANCAIRLISNLPQPTQHNRRIDTNGTDKLKSNLPQHTRHKRLRCDYILLWIILCYFGFQWNNLIEYSFKAEEECKTMDFLFPWESDLNFKSYINGHGDFVGRDWMIDDVVNKITQPHRRGLLIAAELGFGKSALVSHIACSFDKHSSAYTIFKNLAGIHMCRYDSNLTLNPGIFVRNMAGTLAGLFPEYNNILNTESMASKYMTNSKCTQDPNGCFDHIVLNPLHKAKLYKYPLIFIIDALDECIEIDNENIFSLLIKKVHLLPQNIIFLFTSRNISSIRINLPPGVIVYENPSFHENNLRDIKGYIRQRLSNDLVRKQFQTLLGSSNFDENVEKLAGLVDGNFLFLTHAFDFWVKMGNISNPPEDIEHIYHLNVKRILGFIFDNVRPIFEILCASHGSIDESLLYSILNVDTLEQKKYFRLLSNELSHFVQRLSGKIVFTNKRIADFFSKKDNIEDDFYILQKNGHRLISEYWLTHLGKRSNNISLILLKDIFKHVASSKNKSLENRLIDLVHSRLHENEYCLLKHYIAATFNSYDTMLLSMAAMSHMDIDLGDKVNISASFIAAAFGNENTLAALIDNGADINYQRPSPVFIHIKLSKNPIHFCKYISFCGYNLANIASQNGHANVLKLLLRYKINICHENSLGLNSFHLASEHGHLQVLQVLMSSELCNWTSSFDHSLYLGAKNGHSHVIKYLLSLSAVDSCVPCPNSIYWIPKGKARLQTHVPLPNLPYERDYKNYVLRDDRRFFFCESALDIAVQNKHLEVVKILVRQKENALKCVNARGMTPAITAVVFDSKDVIYYFLNTGLPLNDTCTVRLNMKKRLRNDDGDLSNGPLCPNNISFWHMLAKYSKSEVITYISSSSKYDYVWNLTDPTGATPVHYACCNILGLRSQGTISRLASHMLDRTHNGSTPAHVAALCGNVLPITVFMKYHKLPIDIKDYSKKNILHLFALSPGNYIPIDFLSEIINNSYDKLISDEDFDGRTPLHYAAMSGKTLLIMNDYWNITFQPKHYMIQDKFNISALDILFKYMPSHQPKFEQLIVVLPYGCDSDDLFRTPGCSDIRSNILDAFEMFAFKAFTDLRKTNLIRKRNIFVFMHEALKKNRFYLIHMIKVIFPKFYQSICKRKVHFFLTQLMKNSSYTNVLLSSTFLPDLLKYACENKLQYGHLWYMFHDRQRKFWHSYLTWNGTRILDSIKSVLSKCTQKGLVTASLKGGNILPLILARIDLGMYDEFDFHTSFHQAPNIIPLSKYLTPKIYHKINTKYIWHMKFKPYSHPGLMKLLLSRTHDTLHYSVQCRQHAAELAYYHVISAKGLSSVHDKETNENMKKCKNKYSVTPNQLAYFFNHSMPYQEDIDVTIFYQRHFAALFFKITMDFHTFVFPRHSNAWTCFHYVHKVNRKSLKKLACLSSLENEICSLISKLYLMDWRVFFKIYTFDRIKKYLDHEFENPFDFVGYIKHVRTACQHRTIKTSFLHVEKYYKSNTMIHDNCSNVKYSSKSKFCLKHISFINRQRKDVNFKLNSILEMYFPLCYLIYHKYIIELPNLAQKNTIEIIQIIKAYGNTPFFHNNPKYNYWNELKSPFSDPFRTMTRNILTSDIPEIMSWIRHPEFELKGANTVIEKRQFASFNNCLSVYENLTKNDST